MNNYYLRYLIICALSFACGAGIRCFSTLIMYNIQKREMVEYMNKMKNKRIELSKKNITSLCDDKDKITNTFNSKYICNDMTIPDSNDVIKDGLTLYTISMALLHGMIGDSIVNESRPFKIYMGDDFSVVIRQSISKNDYMCIIIRNSDGKFISYGKHTN